MRACRLTENGIGPTGTAQWASTSSGGCCQALLRAAIAFRLHPRNCGRIRRSWAAGRPVYGQQRGSTAAVLLVGTTLSRAGFFVFGGWRSSGSVAADEAAGHAALREKPGGKPASPQRNRHTRLTIPVLWHPLGIDCRRPRTAAHRRLLLPTSHLIGQGEGLNKARKEGMPPRT